MLVVYHIIGLSNKSIVIFKDRVEYNNMKEMAIKIGSELPFGMGITHLFNNGCFGVMSEFDGRPIDSNKKIQINNVFNPLGFNSPPLGAVNTGGAGDLFPRIRKAFKEKPSIPRRSAAGIFY